jgi:hypothetical protein
LAGALKNAGFKIRGEYFRQEREDVELHISILAGCAMPDKRVQGLSQSRDFVKALAMVLVGIDANLGKMVR